MPPELRKQREPDDDGTGGPAVSLAEIAMPNMKPLMGFIEGIVGVSVIAPLVITLLFCRLYAWYGLSKTGPAHAGTLAAEPIPPA